MDVALYDYHLPEGRIAQEPAAERTGSRLMVLQRKTGQIAHHQFSDFPSFLRPHDVLVINDTRVRPARLIGIKEGTGARIELLLLHPLGEDRWEALVKPAKRVKKGTVIQFGQGQLRAIAKEESEAAGGRIFQLEYEAADLEQLLEELGEMPLPPYIQKRTSEPARYQTVYSRAVGSAAAPTAGLHFTPNMLAKIRHQGIAIAPITLHVGLATFRPVSADWIEDHHMHKEYYEISEASAAKIRAAREQGGRVIAVGTTSVRTLETIAKGQGEIQAARGWTDLFIYPGYQFRAVDVLLTNFHLPRSSLLMLVAAFASREYVLHAYEEAVKANYRFFSFGDAMLLV